LYAITATRSASGHWTRTINSRLVGGILTKEFWPLATRRLTVSIDAIRGKADVPLRLCNFELTTNPWHPNSHLKARALQFSSPKQVRKALVADAKG
jgi:hypothetical protein